MKELFQALLDRLQSGEDAVLCSIVASSGSTPRGSGAKLAVFADGSTLGTVGGGAVEFESIKFARQALSEKTAFLKKFDLSSNQTADIGMICGGKVTVYFQHFIGGDAAAIELIRYIVSLFSRNRDAWLIIEIGDGGATRIAVYEEGHGFRFAEGMEEDRILPMLKSTAALKKDAPMYYVEPLIQAGTVYIFGGGHVSQELVPVIAHVGFRTVVYEDREAFADPKLFPHAMGTLIAPFEEAGERLHITKKDYVVIMTRGHQADYLVLEQAMRTPAAYVGVIGSRHKIAATFEKLKQAGIPESELSRIHTPIGLPIKGETPAELAISIAAELILYRAEQSGARV